MPLATGQLRPGQTADRPVGSQGPGGRTERALIGLAIVALGASAMITQLVLMRELLGVFSGNEMILGILLGLWLLLTGMGSALGRWLGKPAHGLTWLTLGLAVLALAPIGQLLAARLLRNVVFAPGAMIGPTKTLAACFILLLPYCLVSGYLFTVACSLVPRQETAKSIARAYLLDSLGMIAGGLAVTFVLVQTLSHFGCLYVSGCADLAIAAALAWTMGHKITAGLAVTALAAIALAAALNLDNYSARRQYPGFDLAYRGNSPYGSLMVTRSAGQLNFIENGVPLFSTNDPEDIEETVHYAMAQRPQAQRVLLIGGGVSGTCREILKYPRAQVDYVELDPLIVAVGRRFVPAALDDRRVRVIEGDGRSYVRQCAQRYDVVILDAPEPATAAANRYYTREFLAEVRRIMNPDAVLALPLARYENYLSKDLSPVIGTAWATLRSQFTNVLVLPGGKLFVVASDGPLSPDIAAGMSAGGVVGQRVTPSYLAAMLSADRMADVGRATTTSLPINTDFNPTLYYYFQRLWISQFDVKFSWVEGALGVGLLLYMSRLRVMTFALFTTGFCASASQIVTLLGFQILFGSVYHRVALIMTMFMVGLAIGSMAAARAMPGWGVRQLVRLEFGLAVFALLLPLILMGLGQVRSAWAWTLSANAAFPLLAMIPGILAGMEFPLAAQSVFQGARATASRLYTADLIGACLGALLISALLIPLIGVTAVCLLTAALKFSSGTVMLAAGRRRVMA